MKKNKTYHIITIGCQMNIADSERLASFLEANNYKEIDNFKKADLVVINTCGVKQAAEDRAYGLVNQVKKFNKTSQVVVMGCLSKREDVKRRLMGQVDLFLPTSEMLNIFDLLAGRKLKEKLSLDELRQMQGEKYLTLLPKYENKFSAYVPIGNGCNNFCAYCVVPYARGREVYRKASSIIKEVEGLVKNGYKEITLIAQNVNSYHDKNYDFPALLKRLLKIKGDFWLRFSSSHPKDMSEELINVIGSSPKICPHLHLAVQSGDNDILEKMNRKYTVERFIDLIEKVRQAKPGIAISSDVIVGFPGETKKKFENTVKLFKRIKFDLVYISCYSPRPGTASYLMKDTVSREEKKKRENILNELLKKTAQANAQKYLGQEVEVLISGINRKGKYFGKTSDYKTILISSGGKINKKLIGCFVKVKINKVQTFIMEGTLEK